MEPQVQGTDDEAKDVYAHFGLAMYLAQVLEHAIVNAMMVARMPERDRVTRGAIDVFVDAQFEKTLGAMMHELRRWVAVPADLEDRLRTALKTRNALAHGYFRKRATAWYEQGGMARMVTELEEAEQLFMSVTEALDSLMAPLCQRFGITQDKLDAEFAQLVNEAAQPSPMPAE